MTPARLLGEEVGALGGAPGDRAEAAAVLAERHLEVALLQRARTVDDLDAGGVEDRPRVGQAERPHRVEAAHQVVRDALAG